MDTTNTRQPTRARRIVGVVLLGGKSLRMGDDKATIEVGGVPMAARVAAALAAGGCEPVTGQGRDVAGLKALDLEGLPDDAPARGPLSGISTALRAYRDAAIVVAACDLAMLTAPTVAALIQHGAPKGRVVVAATGGQRHLLSYWPAASSVHLDALLEAGVHRYREALTRLGAVDLEVPVADMVNLNTPAELARLSISDLG